MSSWIVIGKVGAPYGLEGWVHVQSFTSPIEAILEYPDWWVASPEGWTRRSLLSGRQHGKGLVACLEEITECTQARSLHRKEIAVPRSLLPELQAGQFYWADLEGMQVFLTSGEALGILQFLYHNVGIDVMVIQAHDKAKTWHIPFLIEETVKQVDLIEQRLTLEWTLL